MGAGASMLDLCPRLRVLGVTFRRADPDNLDEGLAALQEAASLGVVVSRLGIEYNRGSDPEFLYMLHSIDGTRFASLLRTAARISPQELVFTNTFYYRCIKADLLCFHHAVSIEMNLNTVHFAQLQDGEFSALERLCLTEGSSVIDLAALLARCPRLRVLKVTADKSALDIITVHSASLEELDIGVSKNTACHSIDIVTPMLKQLNLTNHGNADLGVSVSAPKMGKVSWICSYEGLALVFGFWSLSILKIETAEENKGNEWVLSNAPLPRIDVLSLHLYDLVYLLSVHFLVDIIYMQN
jgi:hypothetical protein